MKLSFNLFRITFLLLAATAFTACLDSTDHSGFEPTPPEISFEGSSRSIDKMGGEVEVALTANLPWRLKSNSSWIQITTPNGNASGKVKFTVQRNRTRDLRKGSVTAYITSDAVATFYITQDPADITETITYYVKTDGDAKASGLTWEEATTLPTAIERAGDGDLICLAEGTYTPVALITGGETEQEKTFEIHSNFTLEGGYPANAQTGAVAMPGSHETILSGNLGAINSYHVVTISAVKPDPSKPTPAGADKAVLKNLTITGGVGYATNEVIRRVAGNSLIDAAVGGGLFIGTSNAEIINCRISENSACHSGGVHVYIDANVSFEGCTISENTAQNNGGGIWNQGGVVYMNNCTISGNISNQQAAGFYSIDSGGAKSISRIYNTLIADNDNTRINAKRSGGGAYIREGSDAVFVNCTFSGNKAGWGGAVNAYGTTARPSKAVCISCTVVANKANDGGGGLFVYNNNGEITAYNTIVSGNTAPGDSADAGVTAGNDPSRLRIRSSILGGQLFDAAGSVVGGWSFSAASMLGELGIQAGGKTRSYPLIVTAENPAVGQGMTLAELEAAAAGSTPSVSLEVIAADQNGTARGGRSIGSVTAQ